MLTFQMIGDRLSNLAADLREIEGPASEKATTRNAAIEMIISQLDALRVFADTVSMLGGL